jgi:uroporphyrinogen decarboxylase
MNKRDALLSLIDGQAPRDYTPAAFFLHFDRAHHQAPAAVDKHLEFFRATGMDFVKIQYEQGVPPAPPIRTPGDWANAPRCAPEYFDPTVRVVEGLVAAARAEALVVLTIYSPFMWARHLAGEAVLAEHLREKPEAVLPGLATMTENVLTLVRRCKQAGIDGFYVSTQGGEAHRFPGTDMFRRYIKPTDLAVWDEIKDRTFNILHVCDYEGPYDDLTPFLDYPGHVVNASLRVGGRTLTPREAAQMFGRPFMGGLERKGVIATGSPGAIREAAQRVLAQAPDRFILAADCTVPSETPWENLKAAIDAAHRWGK